LRGVLGYLEPKGREALGEMQKRPGVMIVGLDGFTWAVADPLIEQGRMPNLKCLIEGGARGSLHSIEPLLSPILWTDIASGKLPAKHGVTRFASTASSLRTKRLWDILEQPDRLIGLWGWPVTWPPRPVNGFLVTSLFDRGNEAHPPELRFVKDLEDSLGQGWRARAPLLVQAFRHGLTVKTAVEAGRYLLWRKLRRHNRLDDYVAVRRLKLNIHLDIFCALVTRFEPYFTAFYMNQADAFGHQFWHYYEPELFADVLPEEIQRYGDVVPSAYVMGDRALGRLLELTNEETLVVALSDHGFQASGGATSRKLRLRPRGDQLLDALRLRGRATYVNYRWSVLLSVADERAAVANELRQFRVERYGQPLFGVGEDELGSLIVYVENADRLADVDLHSLDVVWPGGRLPFLQLAAAEYQPPKSGEHHPEGVIVLHGPGVRPGVRIEGTIVDVAPTILALLGMPVGRDMDGKVLEDAISPAWLARKPVSFIDTYDIDLAGDREEEGDSLPEELVGRLRALGYVD